MSVRSLDEAGAAAELVSLTCVLCGHTHRLTIVMAHDHGWEWFTGFLPKRQECCPRCLRRRRSEFDNLRVASLQRPSHLNGAEQE